MLSARCLSPTQSNRLDGETHEASSNYYIVSNNNRWSRIVLNFEGLEPDTWCEFNFQLEWHPQEGGRAFHDFAVVGIDFLTQDGSSVDFAYVPGLTRTQLDPHSWQVPGPDYFDTDGLTCRIRFGFFVPSPTRNLSVNIRSWRNSQPFTIRDPQLVQEATDRAEGDQSAKRIAPAKDISLIRALSARRTWHTLTNEPTWFTFSLLPGRNLLIRGQIVNEELGPDGALARIVYHNAKGEELPLPYPDMAVSPSVGAFIDIPVHRQTRRFTLDLAPPPEAASVEIGFQTWHARTRMELVSPLEISLENDLLLEAISGDDLPDAPTFLKQFMERLGDTQSFSEPVPGSTMLKRLADPQALVSPYTFHSKLKAVQHGEKAAASESGLAIGIFPSWPLPETLQWNEDPFQSPAWRLEFQSLTWTRDLIREEEPDSLQRAIDVAVSWSYANPWGSPTDPISAHPRAISARAEALLLLLSSSVRSPQTVSARNVLTLLAETVRHAFALAEILGQNVFSHSITQIHAACALLTLARVLPRVPLAPYWFSIALERLRDGFNQLVGEDGVFIEQSMHSQLELVSLGLLLSHHLESLSEAREFHDDLTHRLRKGLRTLVAVTAPSGSLPSFGDAPHGFHHASWLRRLLSSYGTHLLSDHDLATELAYPAGKKVFISAQSGLVAARHYERDAQWSYFCTSLNGRHHEHGHFDCTSFVFSTGGAPWIIDARGSNLHEAGATRHYLSSSRAHNVALSDGREQIAGIGWIETVETIEGASLFHIGSNAHGPDYEHHRVFICLDNLQAIAVVDHFGTYARPISFEGLLHFDTEIIAAIANTQMGVAYRKNEKLRIIPYTIKGQFSGMSIENGRNDRPAAIQGFVSRSAGGLQPANVLRYRFSGQRNVCGGVLLAASDKAARSLYKLLEAENVKKLLSQLSL